MVSSPAVQLVLLAFVVLPGALAVRKKRHGARIANQASLVELEAKSGVGGNTTFTFSIQSGNAVGRLTVKGNYVFTNQGFVSGLDGAPSDWKEGQPISLWESEHILGKSDNFVWGLKKEYSLMHNMARIEFDHGVSDLVFGDLLPRTESKEERFYRLEFQETVYARKGFGQQSAEQVLKKQLLEEGKEDRLQMGTWHPDGYFITSRERPIEYQPRLRIQKGVWEPVGPGTFEKVILERPAILDIDNLFSAQQALPTEMRASMTVNKDASYKGGAGVVPSLGQCWASDSWQDKAQALLGYYCGRTPFEKCATEQECGVLGGRWKEKYCMGSTSQMGAGKCGCCKEIGSHTATGFTSSFPVEMSVEWLAPLLVKFTCVGLEPEFAKTGASSMFIAMGWDTEGDISNLDIDLSLVPFDKMKRAIRSKMVYYNQKTPLALRCPNTHNSYAMRAFTDDRSGEGAGDDELVKLDVACLSQFHSDIESVVVVASIYAPMQLTWNQLDSAYMRFIAGGQETSQSGNFFIRDAQSLKSFVRLSGDSMKADPSLEKNSLAVGMLFRDDQGQWTFAALLEGMTGQSAPQAVPQMEASLQTLEVRPVTGDGTASCVTQL